MSLIHIFLQALVRVHLVIFLDTHVIWYTVLCSWAVICLTINYLSLSFFLWNVWICQGTVKIRTLKNTNAIVTTKLITDSTTEEAPAAVSHRHSINFTSSSFHVRELVFFLLLDYFPKLVGFHFALWTKGKRWVYDEFFLSLKIVWYTYTNNIINNVAKHSQTMLTNNVYVIEW